MEQKASIVKLCKDLGCCDACCLRYLGLKYPDIYENPHKSILKYQNSQETTQTSLKTTEQDPETVKTAELNEESKTTDIEKFSEEAGNGRDSPPAKRRRSDICTSCLGLLQESSWPQCFEMVKEQIEKKRYDCKTFGCALSAPIAAMVREKAVTLHLKEAIPSYDPKMLTPLKEAWKWSFGTKLSNHTNMSLDSGAVSPLLITVTLEYPDESQELEILKQLSPSHFESRSKQKKRFTIEFTRKSVEQALSTVTMDALRKVHGWATLPTVGVHVKCVSVVCTHAPVFLGGRYIKLSRSLPQTPWLVEGKRMMESSVQEIIFEPIAKLYGMSAEEMEHRLKFMSAGREDVDVRCLGDGRPFAIEISDPNRILKPEELQKVCDEINKSGKVIVKQILHVTKDDLTLLKQGEETKKKTYEALCIKLSHTKDDDTTQPIKVTPKDINSINNYRNTPSTDPARIKLVQRTPIRVLHRRPLLSRCREIYELQAKAVDGHPQFFTISLQTQAGTYVKEWVHGSLRRSKPSLGDALGAHVDILALDVTCVHLNWPIKSTT